jgi:hypothetical protein
MVDTYVVHEIHGHVREKKQIVHEKLSTKLKMVHGQYFVLDTRLSTEVTRPFFFSQTNFCLELNFNNKAERTALASGQRTW